MKTFWLGIIGTLMLTTVLRAGNAGVPDCGLSPSVAPYVDNDGYVNPVIWLDAKA